MPATEIQNASAALAPYIADFERFQRGRPAGEPAFVQALRRAGLDRFSALGFPNTRQEEWRLTNVAPIAQGRFHRAPGVPYGARALQIAGAAFLASWPRVFVD